MAGLRTTHRLSPGRGASQRRRHRASSELDEPARV